MQSIPKIFGTINLVLYMFAMRVLFLQNLNVIWKYKCKCTTNLFWALPHCSTCNQLPKYSTKWSTLLPEIFCKVSICHCRACPVKWYNFIWNFVLKLLVFTCTYTFMLFVGVFYGISLVFVSSAMVDCVLWKLIQGNKGESSLRNITPPYNRSLCFLKCILSGNVSSHR